MHFQGEMVHFFLKNEVLRSESVNLVCRSSFQLLNHDTDTKFCHEYKLHHYITHIYKTFTQQRRNHRMIKISENVQYIFIKVELSSSVSSAGTIIFHRKSHKSTIPLIISDRP